MESTTGFSLTTHTVLVFRFLIILLVILWINHFPIARIFSLLMNPVLHQKIELKKYNYHSIVWEKWYIAMVSLVRIITRFRFGLFGRIRGKVKWFPSTDKTKFHHHMDITSTEQTNPKYLGIRQEIVITVNFLNSSLWTTNQTHISQT